MITKTQQYMLNKLPDNLMKHIKVISNGCWLWQVNINGTGYGRVSISTNNNKKRIAAHIYMYELFKGSYDKKLKLDHVYCTHRNCCNPTHLSPVTQQQNLHRSKAARATLINKVIPFKIPEDDNELENLLSEYAYL